MKSESTYSLTEIADAIARCENADEQRARAISIRAKNSAQAGVIVGHKPPKAGRTTARRYTLAEAAFEATVQVLRDFGIDTERAREMRTGFLSYGVNTALEMIRAGEPLTLSLDYSYRAHGASVRCSLHPSGLPADWSPYEPTTRGRGLFDQVHEPLFISAWPITGTLRPFLFSLESPDENS